MRALIALAFAAGLPALAQQRPIFDPNDFVDPLQHGGTVVASRIVLGGVAEFVDDYRPLHQNARVLHIANSVYWSKFQFNYKHTELRAEDNGPVRVQACACSPRVYFPTPPASDQTPSAPPPGRTETLQLGWYRAASPDVRLRYQLTWSYHPIETLVTSVIPNEPAERRSGHERSFGLDADTLVHIGGRAIFGSLAYARTSRSFTTADRTQTHFTYTNRFPTVRIHNVLLNTALTAGSVTGRGARGLNVVAPAAEAFFREPKTRVTYHLVWSPVATRSGADGWQTQNQIAFFVSRALYLKVIGRRQKPTQSSP